MAAEPAIELAGLTRRYGERVALQDVTLTLPAGRTLVVFGPNGAGKSTLLRVLSTLLRPHAGTARVLGHALPENDERADYMRATLASGPNGIPVVTPIPIQDSSMMAALAKADCLVVREPFAPPADAGSHCAILRLTRPF